MRAYLDSSALVKLYYPEPDSESLQKWLYRNRPEILLTALHLLEIGSAMAQKLYRGEVSAEAHAKWELRFERDQVERVFTPFAPDWSRVFLDAERITRDVTHRLGTRSLDILHVAAARNAPSDFFVTNDARQGQAARECGLTVEFVASLH